jgi:hypothetical protein
MQLLKLCTICGVRLSHVKRVQRIASSAWQIFAHQPQKKLVPKGLTAPPNSVEPLTEVFSNRADCEAEKMEDCDCQGCE